MLDLTWWQVLALLGFAAIAAIGGRFVGVATHRALYRRILLARTRFDDRLFLRLESPFQLAGIVLVWQVLVSLLHLLPDALAFCRNVGHIALLLTLGWAAMRSVDTLTERLPQTLAPLARRIANIGIGIVVGVMVIARMGYAIGPLLVLLGIAGACIALAAHRPLENVLAAYAIVGDHGIHEGDTVTLENGLTGTIEQIGLYSTRLRTASKSLVILPNRKLADAQIERAVQRPTTRPLAVISGTGGV